MFVCALNEVGQILPAEAGALRSLRVYASFSYPLPKLGVTGEAPQEPRPEGLAAELRRAPCGSPAQSLGVLQQQGQPPTARGALSPSRTVAL